MTTLLAASGLGRHIPNQENAPPILNNVSLTVGEGEFLTVMGPSGSGKSTLLHCLCGMDRPDTGQVLIAGQDLFALTEKERTLRRRQLLGFVFQFFNLLPDLTVEENLYLPLLIAGEKPGHHRQRLDTLIRDLGLTAFRHRQPFTLSGGEMQRVSIARAMVTRPPLIMADEPTGNLSSKAGEETMALFSTIRDKFGSSILLVTHNPRDAAYGDRVLFLKDGTLDPAATLEGPGLDGAKVFSRLEELGI